ncbi:MAG: carboxypeptidase M32 [Bacteriovoracaceae bacterium]
MNHLQQIKSHLKEYAILKSLQSLMHWDMETMMPAGAIEDRAERLSYIQGKIHEHLNSKIYIKEVKKFSKQKLSNLEKKLAQELEWDLKIATALPKKHVLALSHAATIANHHWSQAKKNNDWKSFQPHLQKLIDLKRAETKYYDEKLPYDSLIKLHDKEFDSKKIQILFSDLRAGLLDIINDVKKDATFTKIKKIKGPFDLTAQEEINLQIAELFGLSKDFSRLDVSTHPFSINISPNDQRITTRYSKDNLDSLFSTMHEVGHAIYEHNLPADWEGTPFQESISLSVHESQSRFWENIIGRSKEFSHFIHPVLKKKFVKSMSGVSVEDLYRFFNYSTPGLIRVESCELYYNMHVIIRFEIEEMIFNHKLQAKDIPAIWNEKYKHYLGLAPKNFSEGILQDSHWAGAAFGYFPTYTIGNLISGSLYQKMKKSMPRFHKNVQKGDFKEINGYLKDHIHSKGRSINIKEIVGEIKVNDYLTYLKEKFEV